MRVPEVHYARSGEVAIAYQEVGFGPIDIVFVRGMSGDLLSTWEQPKLVRHIDGLAQMGRVLMLDKRGTGLSDRVRQVQSLETTMDDIRSVMDAADAQRAVVWTGHSSTGIAVLFAATYPERCAGLILLEPEVRGTGSEEYPWAPTADEWHDRLRAVQSWGQREYMQALAREWAPDGVGDPAFVEWFVGHMRRSLSPGAALTAYRTQMEADVSDVLGAVRVPTLILARPAMAEQSRYVADRIRGARVAELPAFKGRFTWLPDAVHEATMEETARFIRSLAQPVTTERVLTTILFTDIVGSTDTASRLGDAAWRELLARHHALVRRELARFDGRELDTAGDGFFASFEGPARAVRAAMSIRDAVRTLGIEVRAGVHTGECELHDGKLAGIAVSIGARVAALADSGEVLVSSTVKDLVAGSDLTFDDRGAHALKGVTGEWQIYAAG
jgi:class 3 adenylate cyclase